MSKKLNVITGFFGPLKLVILKRFPEGDSPAATEFVRLLEASGSARAKRSNGKAENTQLLGSYSRV